MISLWDEATMFMSSFGRYSGSGSSANYDRSNYNEIFNGGDIFTRDIKGLRCRVNKPRLQIVLLGIIIIFKLLELHLCYIQASKYTFSHTFRGKYNLN